jgi:pimeloyl-ACP methyl ester carboxylesterase
VLRRRFVAPLLLASSLLFGVAGARAVEPADWIGVDGATAERVAEPVFGGRVMLYRAGRRGGEPVVLIHGLGQNGARDWRALIPALADRYDVYALDLPGFGLSDKGNHLYSPDNLVRVIDAVLTRHESRPVVLMGHSFGSAVALAYAAAYPKRVSRLILVDMAGVLQRAVYAEFLSRLGAQLATGVYPDDAPWFQAQVRSILTGLDGFPGASQMVLQFAPVRQRLLRGDANAIAAYALVEHDFSQALRTVKAPTLLIWGSEDKVAPLRTGQLAAATMPTARLAIIRGAGHTPQLEMPARFNAIVLDELKGELAANAYVLAKGTIEGARNARCDGQDGREFRGDIQRLSLTNCGDVQITNARIGSLRAVNSRARILNSWIRDGVEAKNSQLELTAGIVGGSPAFTLDATTVDAAGTRIEAGETVAANRGTIPVALYLSVAEVARSNTVPRYAHEIIQLPPYKQW